MKRVYAFAVLCSFTLLLFACASTASQPEDKPEVAQSGSDAIAAIQTANDLAKLGYRDKSASALIGAAEILAGVQTQSLDAAPEKEAAADASDTKSAKPEFTPTNLLADARTFAAGDATMIAWADKVEKSVSTARGASGGPKTGVDTVFARSINTYNIRFLAGQLAEIGVSGDGDTDLDLYVYDASGNFIVKDDDYSDTCYVRWVPAWTGNFTVKVRNRGSVRNNYIILTN